MFLVGHLIEKGQITIAMHLLAEEVPVKVSCRETLILIFDILSYHFM